MLMSKHPDQPRLDLVSNQKLTLEKCFQQKLESNSDRESGIFPRDLLVLKGTKTAATFHSIEHGTPRKKMYLQKYHRKMLFFI